MPSTSEIWTQTLAPLSRATAVAAIALLAPSVMPASFSASAHAQQTAPAGQELPWADAEIRKIDAASNKVTLKHGEITNLNMPGMTMVFQVRDAKLLDELKAGDKVQVRVIQDGRNYVVTEIRKP